MSWQVSELTKEDRLDDFDCGSNELNEFLQKYALQNQKQRISSTYVARWNDNQVVGYFTLSYAEIHFQSLPIEKQKHLPRYPLSAIRLGRLAVDQRKRGTGLGKKLLIRALEIARKQSQSIKAFAVIVDAKDDGAKSFYKKYGFLEYQDLPDSLYMLMKTIESL